MTSRITLLPRGKPQTLEYAWICPGGQPFPGEPQHSGKPPSPGEQKDSGGGDLVFLHEGLGSIALWRAFPTQVCKATGRRGLVYSRYGYGASSARPRVEALPADYLEREARETLPAFLDALEIEHPWLIGHSDGGSIALLAAAHDPRRYAGIALIAPHYCVEEICLTGIRKAGAAYAQGDLRAKLARYHTNVDATFYGWHDAWLNPARRGWNIAECVSRITCPILAIQGREDEYATLDQIEALPRYAPQTRTCVVENCGHFPHLRHADAVTAAIADFIRAAR